MKRCVSASPGVGRWGGADVLSTPLLLQEWGDDDDEDGDDDDDDGKLGDDDDDDVGDKFVEKLTGTG